MNTQVFSGAPPEATGAVEVATLNGAEDSNMSNELREIITKLTQNDPNMTYVGGGLKPNLRMVSARSYVRRREAFGEK